jgi:hypothetical protein
VTPRKSATSAALRRLSRPYSGLTMKHTRKHTSFSQFRFLILSAALAWTFPLHAAPINDPVIQARWGDLCHVAGGQQLSLTTSDGQTVKGTCASTSDGEIALSRNQRVVKIARSTLIRIQMYQPGSGHHLEELGKGLSKSFKTSFGWLFSPAAPLGLVAIPATVAWGAVAAPFCILGDLGEDGPSTHDIKISD